MGTGPSKEPEEAEPPIQEDSIFSQLHYETSYTQTLPEEPDPSTTCPVCFSSLKPVRDTPRGLMPLLQCPKCPSGHLLCKQCLYPCSYSSPKYTPICTNKSCHIVSTLLKCDLITEPSSSVWGCPLFRACPKCHSLMMHVDGCNNVSCQSCAHEFCYICLGSSEKCITGGYGTCSKAARQRFRT
ncbi:E3 ubiquitin-protein ligase arih1-like [Hoplias malabaricus]|uniref:E3 ubiquitin-protein ligase arih1-like n=1 Tax=Hoplias malabaricus TaxID=27720 RepID=UPI0034628F69